MSRLCMVGSGMREAAGYEQRIPTAMILEALVTVNRRRAGDVSHHESERCGRCVRNWVKR